MVCVNAKFVDLFQARFEHLLGGLFQHGKTQNDSHSGRQYRQADHGNLPIPRRTGNPRCRQTHLRAHLRSSAKGEMQNHLGYANHERTDSSGNARNGYSEKTLKTTLEEVPIHEPRDYQGSFDPQNVKKHQLNVLILSRSVDKFPTRE